jgi:hypothetical protein
MYFCTLNIAIGIGILGIHHLILSVVNLYEHCGSFTFHNVMALK